MRYVSEFGEWSIRLCVCVGGRAPEFKTEKLICHMFLLMALRLQLNAMTCVMYITFAMCTR